MLVLVLVVVLVVLVKVVVVVVARCVLVLDGCFGWGTSKSEATLRPRSEGAVVKVGKGFLCISYVWCKEEQEDKRRKKIRRKTNKNNKQTKKRKK